MSHPVIPTRKTVAAIRGRKGGLPLVCLTAYSAPIARLLDPHCDIILVGDSASMVVHGHANTLPISLQTMLEHAQAVVRSSAQAMVVLDMPFGSYESSPQQAHAAAVRAMKEAGVGAIKIEGGRIVAETIAFLTARGIPVMAHIGLLPQSVETSSGYRIAGRSKTDIGRIKDDALAVQQAGAFCVVVEGTVEPLAAEITRILEVPTIGIGASATCDGQILVIDDLLGLTMGGRTPKFVRRYAELDKIISDAVGAYASDVQERRFPAAEHTYGETTSGT